MLLQIYPLHCCAVVASIHSYKKPHTNGDGLELWYVLMFAVNRLLHSSPTGAYPCTIHNAICCLCRINMYGSCSLLKQCGLSHCYSADVFKYCTYIGYFGTDSVVYFHVISLLLILSFLEQFAVCFVSLSMPCNYLYRCNLVPWNYLCINDLLCL